MNKRTLTVVLTIALVFFICSVAALFKLIQFVRQEFNPMTSAYLDETKLQVPTQSPDNSLAVFNFRHVGDGDARFYAVGFARSLADRLHCAPTCVTQQQSLASISDALCRLKHDFKSPVSDEVALKTTRSLAVRYILTGDFSLSGNAVTIRAHLADTAAKPGKTTLTVTGKVSDLPGLQSQLAGKIASAMNLKLTSEQSGELARSNFSDPRTLLTYGRSFLAEDYKQTQTLRWEMVRREPESSFAVIRLLEYYHYGPLTGVEIAHDTQMQQLIEDITGRFPDNMHIHILKGVLLAKQFRYQEAEAVLTDAVQKDPQMAWPHSALRWVAGLRQNGALAVGEAERAVDIWPNNAFFHAMLAEAHSTASQNARHGHYAAAMSGSVRNKWRAHCQEALREALIATKIDPDCFEGWKELGSVSLQLGAGKYQNKSFEEMLRINPRDINAYVNYAYCYSPQWGGSWSDQQKIITRAQKVFGQDSTEMCVLRARVLLCNRDSSNQNEIANRNRELIGLAEKALLNEKGKPLSEDVMLLHCKALQVNKRRAEMLRVAREGYEKWGTYNWRDLYGMGCAFQYDQQHDRKYLITAEELYRVYAREVPFATRGHIQWGWCLSHLGRREEAKREFLKALELDPANETAKEKLTYVQ